MINGAAIVAQLRHSAKARSAGRLVSVRSTTIAGIIAELGACSAQQPSVQRIVLITTKPFKLAVVDSEKKSGSKFVNRAPICLKVVV